MKKILLTAGVVGLVAVPGVAFASHGAEDRQEHGFTHARQEDRRDDAASSAIANPAPSDSVTEQEARTIAQNQMPGKTILKVEHETEHGVNVFSVRFSGGGRVDVNASDGNIVRTENRNHDHGRHSGRGHHGDDSHSSHRGHSEDR